jgi:hypothetical protein
MADNFAGNGSNFAAFQISEAAARFLFPGFFDLRLNVGVQRQRQAIHDFGHLFARQMARFFDDLIQSHRHGEKLRLVPVERNAEKERL